MQRIFFSVLLVLCTALSTAVTAQSQNPIEWAESGNAEGESTEIVQELGDEAWIHYSAPPLLGSAHLDYMHGYAMIGVVQVVLTVPSPPPEV